MKNINHYANKAAISKVGDLVYIGDDIGIVLVADHDQGVIHVDLGDGNCVISDTKASSLMRRASLFQQLNNYVHSERFRAVDSPAAAVTATVIGLNICGCLAAKSLRKYIK